MLLVIDVGNTQTVVGVYEGADLRYRWRFGTAKTETGDELRLRLHHLLDFEGVSPAQLSGVCLSSVVPDLTVAWDEALQYMLGRPPVVCSAAAAGELFVPDYPNPAEIGADRVADSVAAKALYGAPVVVVDFGTATNICVIDEAGRFVGGVIAPGLETSASALFSRATKLGAIDLEDPHTAIGRNTAQAMQEGIVVGEAERVDGLVRRIFEQLGYEAPVVATGGHSSRMAPLTKVVTEVNPDLTLEGLRLVYEAQEGADQSAGAEADA